MTDGDHWLWRHGAQEWLDAAARELEHGHEQLRSRRTAVTHARRAAGMALNGVLVAMVTRGWSRERCETAWGRSYIDHVRSLAAGLVVGQEHLREPFDAEQSVRCRALLNVAVMPPSDLIRLARHKDEAAVTSLDTATAVVHACAAVIQSHRPAGV